MPVFTVGTTEIPYEVNESARAKRMRLTLKSDRVAVTVPKSTESSAVEIFLLQNQKWVCEKWLALLEQPPFNPWPERFEPGAKVFFRGRWETIVARTTTDLDRSVASYRQGIVLEVAALSGSEDEIKRSVLDLERREIERSSIVRDP